MEKKKISKTALISFIVPIAYSIIFFAVINTRSVDFVFGLFIGIGYGLAGIFSLIFGITGVIIIRKNPKKYCGLWAGITGIILGIIIVIFFLLTIGVFLFFRGSSTPFVR